MKRLLLLLIPALVVATAQPAEAGNIVTTLGTPSAGLTDGTQYSIGDFTTAQAAGQPAPFGVFGGFDNDIGPSLSESWTFSYGAIADVITAATITLGIYDHDSAATGDQVASFGVDGNDLTAALNTAFNGSGGTSVFSSPPLVLTSEYNIYTIGLSGSALSALADGSAEFSLTLQNGLAFPSGNETNTTHNGAGLDFATLDITTQDSARVVPEPSSLVLLLTGGLGLFGYGWRRKKNRAA